MTKLTIRKQIRNEICPLVPFVIFIVIFSVCARTDVAIFPQTRGNSLAVAHNLQALIWNRIPSDRGHCSLCPISIKRTQFGELEKRISYLTLDPPAFSQSTWCVWADLKGFQVGDINLWTAKWAFEPSKKLIGKQVSGVWVTHLALVAKRNDSVPQLKERRGYDLISCCLVGGDTQPRGSNHQIRNYSQIVPGCFVCCQLLCSDYERSKGESQCDVVGRSGWICHHNIPVSFPCENNT